MPNQLINQTSPYLLQHANNPVDWYPWEEQALELARSNDRPILLSIGYSACHWCHVMEKESFEDPEIAEIMNKNFVCIKVDREERPDLDKIYQLSHQLLTQRPGGWPLTIALTPDGHAPFFAGTYFPPESRFNMPGFGQLLKQIAGHYQENRDQLADHHQSFNQALEKLNPVARARQQPKPASSLQSAVKELEKQFDSTFGGFGDAPKFPHPSQVELLLVGSRLLKPATAGKCADMARLTLSCMADGGLFDQLVGGFFRYSVDRQWQIPHFEKMLYDNAQLLSLYSDAITALDHQRYSRITAETAEWTIAEMQLADGGYASTLDADSEGEEGRYYVWSETDLRAILSPQQYSSLENYFALYGEANFEGNWHFNLNPEIDHSLLSRNPEIEKSIFEAKNALLQVRNQRIRPNLDDKVLTAWNGLMIKGMARAGRILDNSGYIDSAIGAADFIRNNMWQGNRLLATCNQGKARLNGYLDDYAFLLGGLLELLETRWRGSDFEFAIAVCNTMLDRFEDSVNGGFYFTSHDHESLLYRPKSGADDAIPSGNSAAIMALIKLGNLIGEPRYLESAAKTISLFADEIARHPSVNGSMTIALQHLGNTHTTVVIRGEPQESANWMKYCNKIYRPLTSIYAIDSSQDSLPPELALRKPGKSTLAYVCQGTHCSAPVDTLEELEKILATPV